MSGRDRQRLHEYLEHILTAIRRINRYVNGLDEMRFRENEMVQDAVIRNFEIIGEALHNIDVHYPDFVKEHAELPWDHAYGMRNVLSHGYFKVDLGLVWRTVQQSLPTLEQQILRIQQALGGTM